MSIKQLAMRLVYGHKASSGAIHIMAPKPGSTRGTACASIYAMVHQNRYSETLDD